MTKNNFALGIRRRLAHKFFRVCYVFLAVGKLGPDDLVDVLTELVDVCAADWENIGLGLRLKPGTLGAMKGPFKEPKDCLRDMLKEWLNTSPDPSWQSLIRVLRSPIVGQESLARRLETTRGGSVPGKQGCSY